MEDFNFFEGIQEKQLDFYSAYVLIPTHAWLVWEVLWWAPYMVSSVTCMSGWMIIAEAAEEGVPECLGQRKWLSFFFMEEALEVWMSFFSILVSNPEGWSLPEYKLLEKVASWQPSALGQRHSSQSLVSCSVRGTEETVHGSFSCDWLVLVFLHLSLKLL